MGKKLIKTQIVSKNLDLFIKCVKLIICNKNNFQLFLPVTGIYTGLTLYIYSITARLYKRTIQDYKYYAFINYTKLLHILKEENN